MPQMNDSLRVLAFAAAAQAGTRSMLAAGRVTWTEEDWNAVRAELDRVWPEVIIAEIMK